MRPRPIHSVGRRLSRWLALQTFLGLGLVCLAVYLFTLDDVEQRQVQTLVRHHGGLENLLTETRQEGDWGSLRHRLNEFFTVRPDLALSLACAAGPPLYDNTELMPAPYREHRFAFAAAVPGCQAEALPARLLLSTADDAQSLARLRATLGSAALIGVLLVTVGSFGLVRVGLAPVRLLVEQTKRLSAGDLSPRLDGSGQPLELQPLVQQFNALLERIERAYAQLDGFNADVAHELRSPLSTLIAGIELALRGPLQPDAVRELLGSNLEELRRMSRIVKDMLFLSHADSGAPARREWVPSLAALLQQVAEYHEAALADAELGWAVEGDASGHFDGALLQQAVSNLLSNATRYAVAGSTVRLRIDDNHPDAGSTRLSVVNQGPPIDPVHLPRLFDRFYRSEAALHTPAQAHHGLGLSIVAAIARMHRGRPFARSDALTTEVGFSVQRSDG
ncbi:MAG: heavy metal sensor histidine kinase [Pseudomonadota bacterium]